MTVQEQVRRRLDETTERFWDDDDIDDWCSEAAHEVARRSETLQELDLMTVPAGDDEVTLPTTLLRVHLVLWHTPTPDFVRILPYQPQHAFTRHWRPGEPWCYTIWGRALRLDRAVIDESTFYLAYYRIPSDLDDVPNGWEDLIVDYCEYQALRKDADPRHTEAKALFESKLAQMIDTTRSWTDQMGHVAHTGREFYFNPEPPAPAFLWDEALWDQATWS